MNVSNEYEMNVSNEYDMNVSMNMTCLLAWIWHGSWYFDVMWCGGQVITSDGKTSSLFPYGQESQSWKLSWQGKRKYSQNYMN